MDFFYEIINNKFIYVPVLLWFSIQCFKVICDLIKTKKFNFKRVLGAGGMPSSHAAVVCSLAALVGKYCGFASAEFGIAFVLALVVMYDAAGVRRAAGKQAKLLNKIVETPGLSALQVQERLVEVLGHSPLEVFVGALLGVVVGMLV